MNPIILETMNDIINQVETREWNRINGHRDRLLKKMRKQTKVIEEMSENWEVATEKIGQENSDLHNEIKRLKDQIKKYENRWKMFNVEQELEIKLLTAEYGSEEIRNCMDENEKLKKDNWSLKLEVKSAQEVTMAYMKRFDKLAEIKVERACSRIKCEDKFGHLIGRIPTDK